MNALPHIRVLSLIRLRRQCGGNSVISMARRGSEQFVNPLMPLYWYFRLPAIAERIVYRDAVMASETMAEFLTAFRDYRDNHPRRSGRRDLPI